jgi:uroporphyrinogen decarboxylase
MNPRERVLAALARQQPDRVPKTMSLCPSQLQRFRQVTGSDSPAEYFGFEVRNVSPDGVVVNTADFSPYLGGLPAGARVDEWGIAWVRGSEHHFERMVHPLRDATSTRDVERYPFPDLAAPERFTGLAAQVRQVHDDGLAAVASVTPVGGTVFWPAYKLRGMESLLMDLLVEPRFATALLDRVTEISSALAARLATFDVDVLWLADDFGTQRALIVGLDAWRQWFKGRLKQVVEAAKSVNPRLVVAFHSDGKVDEIIPDLIDIGIDVLNPLQPEVMDIVAIKREYGHELAFWGGIGTQTTMPFATPAQVRETVQALIATVGDGGGLLAAPTHVVEPEVPWENIMAFLDAVNEYGVYA